MKALAIVAIAVLAAGCTAPSASTLPPSYSAPTRAYVPPERPSAEIRLALLSTDVETPKVRLQNVGAIDLSVSQGDFQLVDGNGTVTTPDWQTEELGSHAFPLSVTLGPGESAQGIIVFVADPDAGPYTLEYRGYGVQGSVAFPYTPPSDMAKTKAANQTHVPGIGDWINGTYIRGHLISATNVTEGNSPSRAAGICDVAIGFEYFTGQQLFVKVEWRWDVGTWQQWNDSRPTLTTKVTSLPHNGDQIMVSVFAMDRGSPVGPKLDELVWTL